VRFAFSEDQLLFRDTVRDFLQKEFPADALRARWIDEATVSPAWQGLADMGVIGLTIPEVSGGLGMNELDLVLLLEETGRAAFADPIVETTAVVAPLLAGMTGVGSGSTPAAAWLTAIAAGDLRASTNLGGPLVPSSDVATLFVIDEGERLVALDRDAVRLVEHPSVDGSRHLAQVTYDRADAVVLAEGAGARALAADAFDRGALGTAAQLLGLADHLLATTVDYVNAREQFGVPIGSFQAIKHHLADALLALEFARPVVYRAAYSLALGIDTAPRDVSMAKCYASDAATVVARKALQCHGAIGYTVEYDLHLWLKRVWALAAAWGDAPHHRARVAESVLGPRP
jgi:alkylation response protein AidB-like acyl-CoA dehydrogenase